MTTASEAALPDRVDSPRSGSWRLVAPLVLVTGFAMYGQIGYGYDHYSADDTNPVLRLGVAIGAAVAVESIALYVQWHAHDALLLEATATAARLRRASYLIALAVAGVNYAHFAGPGLAPTAGAIVFALFSAAGPWLWGLHTRRAQQVQLKREGKVDSSGAVFSSERWRAFPWRTWQARRFSIDFGIDHPREAWERYRDEVTQRRTDPEPATVVDDEQDTEEFDLDQLNDPDPFGWWKFDHDAGGDRRDEDQGDEELPAYRDESKPIGDRIDLAVAAELAAGNDHPGQRRLAEMLGTTRHKVRDELERRASQNGHRQEIPA